MIHSRTHFYTLARLVVALLVIVGLPAVVCAQAKGRDTVGSLIHKLNHRNVEVRLRAIETLGRLKDARAIGPLLGVLKRDTLFSAREKIVMALNQIGPPAMEALITSLDSHDQRFRHDVSWALGKMLPLSHEPLVAALAHESDLVRRGAIRALGRGKDVAAVDPLLTALDDRNALVRAEAAEALGQIGSPRAVDPLLAVLPDVDASVRHSATEALTRLLKPGDGRAVEPLIDLIKDKNDAYWYSRAHAAEALGLIGDEGAVPTLISVLGETNSRRENDLRCRAAVALGRIGDTRALEPLITISLSDADATVREYAKQSLDSFKSQGKLPISILLKHLTRWWANPYVSYSLKDLGWQPSAEDDRIHNWVAQRDGAKLRDNWEVVKQVLLQDVDSSAYTTIENALFAFIGIGKPEVISLLLERLSSRGNKTMAEAYLNCGHEELGVAARAWAARHGYPVKAGPGAHPIGWGKM